MLIFDLINSNDLVTVNSVHKFFWRDARYNLYGTSAAWNPELKMLVSRTAHVSSGVSFSFLNLNEKERVQDISTKSTV